MRLVELSRREHAELRIRADQVEASAASQHLIPIVTTEFRRAAIQYPIVFAKSPETGHFAPYVLNGLAVEENLFWTGTELDVAYVPLNVRRQPFYVSEEVLCIDVESACLDTADGQRLINPDGTDSAYLKDMLSILSELVAGKKKTDEWIATLLGLDLIAPVQLDIVLEDKTPLHLQGLYSLDEEKLRQLEAAAITKLWKSGALDLIYAVMISSGQIYKLIRLKNQRMALRRAWHE